MTVSTPLVSGCSATLAVAEQNASRDVVCRRRLPRAVRPAFDRAM